MRKTSRTRPVSASSDRARSRERSCNGDGSHSGATFAAASTSGAAGCVLRGVDLVEQIAQSSRVQRQRWTEIYTKLWERKAKIDIADTIVLVGGTPRAWFFTSPVTGEVQRKHDHKLNAIAIKKYFVRASDPALLSRHIAVLLHEDRGGSTRYSTLTDLEFNAVLCQPSSPLWMASFLLQPFTPLSRRHPQYRGTFVAKFNALATTSCIRVLQVNSYFYDITEAPYAAAGRAAQPVETRGSHSVSDSSSSSSSAARSNSISSRSAARVAASTAPAVAAAASSRPETAAASSGLNHAVEEIIKTELRKVVREVESAFHDKLRLFTGEFQITSTHRLVLMRVSHVVFFSDAKVTRGDRSEDGPEPTVAGVAVTGRGMSGKALKTQRPSSASSFPGAKRCAGGSFCHCKIFASAAALKVPLPSTHEFQRITRKSLSLSEDESAYLEHFGAHAEATLAVSAMAMRSHSQDAFTKLLQRRIFMLQSTLWNPKSDAFKLQPLEFDTAKKLPQQYEMTQVCKTCYLIYHTIDSERFQASRSTSKAAARLYNAKVMSSLESAVPVATTAATSPSGGGKTRSPTAGLQRTRAWESEDDSVGNGARCGRTSNS